MADYFFEGTVRKDMGKGASRRLRREGNIPAIVYGAGKDAVSIVLNHNEVLKRFRHEDIYTSIVTLKVDGEEDVAILRDVQRHPYKPLITHLDFMRVRADEAIIVDIPVELINEEKAHGVVHGGGQVTLHMASLPVSCLPKDLPNVIQVDISDLELGENLMISDIPAIPNVDFVDLMNEEELNDQPVVSIIEAREFQEPEEDSEDSGVELGEEGAPEEAAEEADSEE